MISFYCYEAIILLIRQIDTVLVRQINAILHNASFQSLEASWRGLFYLVHTSLKEDANLKIQILNASWEDLKKDLLQTIDFDQSYTFKKIYSQEFGTSGGEPFGLIIGDYFISHHPQNLEVLGEIAQIAAAAFAPFVAAASPTLFELDYFTDFQPYFDLERTLQQTSYNRWKNFCRREETRFVGLVLPRVLMRAPYQHKQSMIQGFHFVEDINHPKSQYYLWGHAGYYFAHVVMRSFSQTGWFVEIRGTQSAQEKGGIVCQTATPLLDEAMPFFPSFYPTEILLSDEQEKKMSDLGFIALCGCKHTNFASFYALPTLKKPDIYSSKDASLNEKISTMLHYILCVSRFAHYVKVIVRDKVGSFITAQECETYLQNWILKYTSSHADLSSELLKKYPLREAKVSVKEEQNNAHHYICSLYLRPHDQLDNLMGSLEFKTSLPV